MRTFTIGAGLLCALALSACVGAQEKTVRMGGIEVVADSPLAKKEHPRLLLTRSQLAGIRSRLKDPEIAALLDFARQKAKAGQADSVLLGVLYQLTGEKAYADQARAKLGPPSCEPTYCWALDLVAETMTEAEMNQVAAQSIACIKANRWGRRLLLGLVSLGHGHDDELLPMMGDLYKGEIVEGTAGNNAWSQGRGGSSQGHGYNGDHFYSPEFAAVVGWSNASGIDWIGKADYAAQTPAWYIYHYRPWGRSVVRIGVTGQCDGIAAIMPRKFGCESLIALSATRDRNGLAQAWLREFIGKIDIWGSGTVGTGGLWGRLLWLDPSIPSVPIDRFPPTRLFPVNGHVIMRSDWTPQATMALFRCGRFGTIDGGWGRNNADNLHFIILKQGILTESSGARHGINEIAWKMAGPNQNDVLYQVNNYGRQTVAFNSITVGAEDLPMRGWDGRVIATVKRGGQSPLHPDEWMKAWGLSGRGSNGTFKEGTIVAYETSPVFDYAAGDARYSYPPQRVNAITRQFVYLKPDLFVVFDRVTPASPDLETVWNLHTLSKPSWNGVTSADPAWTPERQSMLIAGGKIVPNPHPGGHFLHAEGDTFVADDGIMEGRLFMKVVLPGPKERVVRTVGGPWHDFEINGVNYGPTEETYKRKNDDRVDAMGVSGWRIELVDNARTPEKQFLTVLQASTRATKTMAEVLPVQAADRTGVEIRSGATTFRVLFNVRGKIGGHVTVTEPGKGAPVGHELVETVQDNYSNWSSDPRYKEWMTNPYMRTIIGPAEQDAWKAAHPAP